MGTEETLLNKVGFIYDMDGVIYHGDKIIDRVVDLIK